MASHVRQQWHWKEKDSITIWTNYLKQMAGGGNRSLRNTFTSSSSCSRCHFLPLIHSMEFQWTVRKQQIGHVTQQTRQQKSLQVLILMWLPLVAHSTIISVIIINISEETNNKHDCNFAVLTIMAAPWWQSDCLQCHCPLLRWCISSLLSSSVALQPSHRNS